MIKTHETSRAFPIKNPLSNLPEFHVLNFQSVKSSVAVMESYHYLLSLFQIILGKSAGKQEIQIPSSVQRIDSVSCSFLVRLYGK